MRAINRFANGEGLARLGRGTQEPPAHRTRGEAEEQASGIAGALPESDGGYTPRTRLFVEEM